MYYYTTSRNCILIPILITNSFKEIIAGCVTSIHNFKPSKEIVLMSSFNFIQQMHYQYCNKFGPNMNPQPDLGSGIRVAFLEVYFSRFPTQHKSNVHNCHVSAIRKEKRFKTTQLAFISEDSHWPSACEQVGHRARVFADPRQEVHAQGMMYFIFRLIINRLIYRVIY